MFKHIYFYQLKAQIRNKENVFWLLMFPIILTTLFQFVLSDIMSAENFVTIPIAVVKSVELEQDVIFTGVLEDVSVSDDEYKRCFIFRKICRFTRSKTYVK